MIMVRSLGEVVLTTGFEVDDVIFFAGSLCVAENVTKPADVRRTQQ
jgi:hypothetical protein